MNREMKSCMAVREGIRPQVQAAGTVNGEIIDTRGFDAATLMIAAGTVTAAGVVNYKIQHGEQAGGGDMADVVVADDQTQALTAPLAQNTVQHVGYRGSKRYVRAVSTYVSGTSVAHGALWMLGMAAISPAV